MTETITESMMNEHIHVMDTDEAVKLVKDLCAQLDSGEEICHGNIWPGNVCINEDGVGVLGESSRDPAADRNAVQVEYLPPEFFWDNSTDPAGDVYSLGLLLYAGCNGGYLPFQPKGALTDRERSQALRKRMKGEPITLPAGIDARLGAVMLKTLAYNPEDRYQSPGELLTALTEMDELAGEDPAAAESVSSEEGPIMETAAVEEADGASSGAWEQMEFGAVETEQPAVEFFAPEEEIPAPAEEPVIAVTPIIKPERNYTPTKKETRSSRKKAEQARKLEAKTAKAKAKAAKKAPVRSAAVPVKRRKKSSPAIPILCIAALAVIAGAAWVGFNHGGVVIDRLLALRHGDDSPEVSALYIAEPEATPEATEPPVPSSVEDDVQIIQMALPEITPEPIPEPTATPVTGSSAIDGLEVTPADDIVTVTTSGTNLRGGPGTGYDIEQTLSRGTALQRTGTVSGWSQVQYRGEEYYVSTNLVEVDDSLTAADLVESPEATSAPSAMESLDSSSAAEPAEVYSGANVTETRDVVTTTSDVNLRSGPSTAYSIVATVDNGTNLQRTGTVNGWSRVTYQGNDAYIINTYISSGSGGSGSSQASDGNGTLRVVSDVNVRTGPGTENRVLGIAKTGTTLTYTGVSSDGKWYHVYYNGEEGYVNRKLVSVQSSAQSSSATSGTGVVTMLANIRSGPGTGYRILGQASAGSSLTVKGHTGNNWYEVEYNGQTGYIAGNLLRVN